MQGLLRRDSDPIATGQRARTVSRNHFFTCSGLSWRAMCTGAVWHTYILNTICFLGRSMRSSGRLWVRRCPGRWWRGLLLDDIPNRAVALQPALVHPRQHRNTVIYVVVDLHDSLVVVETMQPAHVLLQRPLPGDRHRQE